MTQDQSTVVAAFRDAFNVDRDAWWLRTDDSRKSCWPVKIKIAGVHLSDFHAVRGRQQCSYLIIYIYNTHSTRHVAMDKIDNEIFLNLSDAREFAEEHGYEF